MVPHLLESWHRQMDTWKVHGRHHYAEHQKAHAALPPLPRGYRAVPGFVGYAVNRKGAVISCRRGGRPKHVYLVDQWHQVHLLTVTGGYKAIHVYVPGQPRLTAFVHRMVLLAFVGPCPRGMEACHNNGQPGDNRVENLRWDTRSNNLYDRIRHGWIDRSETKAAKLTPAIVRAIRASTESHAALGRHYKVHWKTISRARNYKAWKRT